MGDITTALILLTCFALVFFSPLFPLKNLKWPKLTFSLISIYYPLSLFAFVFNEEGAALLFYIPIVVLSLTFMVFHSHRTEAIETYKLKKILKSAYIWLAISPLILVTNFLLFHEIKLRLGLIGGYSDMYVHLVIFMPMTCVVSLVAYFIFRRQLKEHK